MSGSAESIKPIPGIDGISLEAKDGKVLVDLMDGTSIASSHYMTMETAKELHRTLTRILYSPKPQTLDKRSRQA